MIITPILHTGKLRLREVKEAAQGLRSSECWGVPSTRALGPFLLPDALSPTLPLQPCLGQIRLLH